MIFSKFKGTYHIKKICDIWLRYCLISIFLLHLVPPLYTQDIPRYGGRLILTTVSDPRTFNPVLAQETSSTNIISNIFEGLTMSNPYTTQVEPLLAERWSISEDELEWTMYIKRDILWNDGIALTTDDILFTFYEVYYNPKIPNSTGNLFMIDGKRVQLIKIDDYTIKFVLSKKYAPFLRLLAVSILPKHKLQHIIDKEQFMYTWGIDANPKDIVGTGPFKLKKYEPGQRIILEKNPYYWKKWENNESLPFLDELKYIIVSNTDVALLKFMEQSLDIYSMRGSDFSVLKPLEEKNNFKIYDLGSDMGSQFLVFNQNLSKTQEGETYIPEYKLKWFRDKNFRAGVAYCLDRKKMISIVKHNFGIEQHTPIGKGSGFFHNPDVKKYSYSPEKSILILNKAGYIDRDKDGYLEDRDGYTIEFNIRTSSGGNERIEILGMIRSDLERVGIKANMQIVEFNTLVGQLTSTYDWESILIGLTGSIEPHFGRSIWMSAGHLHMWWPKQKSPSTEWEKQVDQIFIQGAQELNRDRRKEYYDQFQNIIADELPLIYTILGIRLTAIKNKFKNISPSYYGGILHNIEEIYIK